MVKFYSKLSPFKAEIYLVLFILVAVAFINIQNLYGLYGLDQKIPEKSSDDVYITLEQAFAYNKTQKSDDYLMQSSKEPNSVKKKKHRFENKVWFYNNTKTYSSLSPERKLFEILNVGNNKAMVKADGYSVMQIDQNNYNDFLTEKTKEKIRQALNCIEQSIKTEGDEKKKNQLNQAKAYVEKRLIIYSILHEKGGIYIDNKITVIQRLSTWLQKIMTLPYINVGDKIDSQIQLQCFGFFFQQRSSLKKPVNVKRKYEFEKKMHLFPSIQDQFFACYKSSQYLSKLIQIYLDIIQRKQSAFQWALLNKNQNLIGQINVNDFYKQGHLMANHAVLQEHQANLDKRQKPPYRKLAIDDLGLVSMNTRLGPRKMQNYLPNWNSRKSFKFLTKLTLQELELNNGKMRFAYLIEPWVTQMLIEELKVETETNYTVEGSFFQTFYLRYLPENVNQIFEGKTKFRKPFVHKVVFNESENSQKPLWLDIPKHLWVIWDQGLIKNSTFLIEMCSTNLKRSAENSGMQYHAVSNQNIKDYLTERTLRRINYTIKNAKFQIKNQAISDIWRLALMYEHGGIYVDSTTFTMDESFEWVKNITRIPSILILNRFNEKPNVLMFWNSYYTNDGNWVHNTKYNTKSMWHVSYESNFIAAVKDDAFIKEWFDLFLEWIVTPFEEIEKQMKNVEMKQKWTSPNNRYLTVMDSVIYVSVRRQRMLQSSMNKVYQNSAHFYNIWSISGQMSGQLKFRDESNLQSRDYRNKYQQPDNEAYRFQYSLQYVESVDGPAKYQAKFFGLGRFINFMMLDFFMKKQPSFDIKMFEALIHPESLLGSKLVYKYPERIIYLLSYYSNLMTLRLKMRGQRTLGFG